MRQSKQLFAMFVTCSLALSPNMVWAEGALLSGSKTNGSSSSTATSSGGLGGTSYVPAQASNPTTTKTEAMLNNAKEAKDKQNSGKTAAMIAAGVMAATAAATCPACTKRGTCPICYAAVIGAAAAALTASQMDKAKNKSNQQAYDVNPVDTKDGSKDIVLGDTPEYQNVTKGISNAGKSAGMKVSNDMTTVTTPDGRTISVADAVSGGGGGLSSSEQAALAANLKAAQAQVAAKMGKDGTLTDGDVIEEYSGGGRGGIATAAADTPAVAAAEEKKGREPSSVEGAFREYNGEKIGVAMDSMFEMMHRRYKHHAEDRNSFLANQ